MNTGNAHIERRSVGDERLDSAIDAVARDMTGAEPSGALRAAVLERIERQRRPLPAAPRWAWAGAMAALMLAVAATLWLSRPPQAPADPDTTVASQRPVGPAAQPLSPGPAPIQLLSPSGRAAVSAAGQPAPDRLARRTLAVRRLPQAGGAAAGPAPADDARVPALADIEPLAFPTVEPSPLSLPVFEVAPLDPVPTIDIPSLNPGSTDTQSGDPKKEK